MTTSIDRRLVAQLGLVVAGFAVVGVLAGVVWQWLWTPTMGVAYSHTWTAADAIGLQQEFSGTGWYVAVGVVAGLVAGVATALLAVRVPLLTLAAVVVGSVLAAWLMLVVGTALGPADQDAVAATAADGTKIPMALAVTGRSPWIALPSGALIGVVLVFVGIPLRSGGAAPEQTPAETGAAG
ncbi:hypothetical protein ASC77_03240 [Nocardioides sp. Root1257]|uniref:hypothetical protein n=1 Tax=unclassified Nocardioides TaxID=2615069 RepID=UPI0006FAB1DB|nr:MULTISPECIES: hypothetical protein [unclassified Nocardioides]KQW53317.1 hypothetical protein ASC77_03240 [Nocardioides sp. Root1257]KRC56003.1 hypothetical protein ASE24_03240 [Nocardioides sp. Root224]